MGKEKIQYELMHGEKITARIDTAGHCAIIMPEFLPYALYLEEEEGDIDTLVNNITNFYYWCASRVLTLDRKYAKEILNSIGARDDGIIKHKALHPFRSCERAEIRSCFFGKQQ